MQQSGRLYDVMSMLALGLVTCFTAFSYLRIDPQWLALLADLLALNATARCLQFRIGTSCCARDGRGYAQRLQLGGVCALVLTACRDWSAARAQGCESPESITPSFKLAVSLASSLAIVG